MKTKGCQKGANATERKQEGQKGMQNETNNGQKGARRNQQGAKRRQKGPQRKQKGTKSIQKGPQREQKGTKREPKGDKNGSKNRLGRQGRFGERKVGVARQFVVPFLVNFSIKGQSQIDAKNDVEKTCKIIAKGSQNGTEIDTKTHQKSMPELVSKKIREIIKNHISLKSEIIEIHWTNNGF